MLRIPTVVCLTYALAGAVAACAQAPAVRAEHAWARATPPGAPTAAAYVTLTSAAPDRLMAATTPVAGMTDVHENIMDGTVMKMRPVAGGLALPPGTPVSLAPGGYHIMLMDMKHPLKAGDSFPLTLTFAQAPAITVTVTVQPIGATSDMPRR